MRGEYVLACGGANSTLRDDAGIDLRGPVLANMGSALFRSPTLFRDAARPLLSWVYTPDLCGLLIAHAAHRYIFITGVELPEWKQAHNKSHRKVRARVEHAFARMKTWKILRDCRTW